MWIANPHTHNQRITNPLEHGEQGVSIDSSELMAHVHRGDVSFFGKPLHLVDAHYVMRQIKEIAEGDDRLSLDGCVLTIENVSFGINIHGCSLSLLSSVQVYDPKMGKVIEYFNSLYGAAEADDSENYYWYVGADGEYKGRLVARMRPLHSDEGGTVIFFY